MLRPTKKKKVTAWPGTFIAEILVIDKKGQGDDRRIRQAVEHISTILNLGKEDTDSHTIFCSYHHIILPVWAVLQTLQYFHLAMSTGLGVLSCPRLSSQYAADDQFQQVRLTM